MTVPFRDETCEVRGCKIALKRGGSGPLLLYLHGANGAAAVQPFMQDLARDHEVLVPEHPGFGRSDEPGWLDNIHDLAYFYLDFIEQLDLRDIIMAGSSLGGWLALEIAVRDASRVKALSVVAPAGIFVPGLARGDLFLWSPEERVRNLYADQTIADQLLAQAPAPAEQETALKNEFAFARIAWEPRLFDPHLHKWLHRIGVPTQVLWGADDRLLPAAYAAQFKKLIAHARIDLIPDCGHLPHIEKPLEFVRLFREFAARGFESGSRAR